MSELKWYHKTLLKPRFHKKRRHLINRVLQSYGYDNYQNDELTGERFFIENVLAATNPKLCLDIGANVGGYSEKLLSLTASKVIAFEPQPNLQSALADVAVAFSDRLTVVSKGVGSRAEKLVLHYNEDADTHASFIKEINEVPYVDNHSTVEIDVVTLDEFFSARPDVKELDLIKVDTEGFEAEVLEGARNTIANLRPSFVQFEYGQHQMVRGHSVYSLTRNIPEYVLFQLVPNGMERRDPLDPLSNVYLFSNFVLVRPDIADRLPILD